MTRPIRSFFYALICLGLIVAVHFLLPASFYTLATILGLLVIFFALRGVRGLLRSANA